MTQWITCARSAMAFSLLFGCTSLFAAASVTVTINENTTQPLPSGYAGYNAGFAIGASSMLDTNLQSITQTLAPGWLRYPGGTLSDAFDLNSGYMNLDWATQLDNNFLLTAYYQLLGRKGGANIADMNTFVHAVKAKGIIACANGFTDTPSSIGTFAANAKAHAIPIMAYELANEPYLYPNIFSSSTAYLKAMQPYAAAIKAADPTAKLSVFIKGENATWNSGIANFAQPYWDYVSFHDYPPLGTGELSTLIPKLNQVLSGRAKYISSAIGAYTGKTPIMITEFGPGGDTTTGFYGTLYGGIYVAEYALRLVTLGTVINVGPHALLGNASGVGTLNDYNTDVFWAGQQIAANKPGAAPLDTTSSEYDFGYFVNAQAAAYSLVSKATATASLIAATTVSGGGNVPILNNGTMPAVYAQAFTNGSHTWLVITNKSSTPQTVNINDKVRNPGSSVSLTTVAAQDPLTMNTSSTAATNSSGQAVPVVMPVTSIAKGSSVPLPAYSVVLVDW